MKRRRWVGGALLGTAVAAVRAQVPAWSLEAQQRLIDGPEADPRQALATRQALAQAGETALARGDVEAAEAAFDRATGMVHSADVEMGLVRTYMQAGDYRRALTFASHAAGAHPQVAAGTALYAWLLQVGGQTLAAERFLREGMVRAPGDPALVQTSALLSAALPVLPPDLLAAPLRAAPYAHGESVPSTGRIAGTAYLLAGGENALVPLAALHGARSVWLRNAMGKTVAAGVQTSWGDQAIALLRLGSRLPEVPWLQATPREPFAGSPAFTFEYSPSLGATPAWPLLRQGFFGRATPGSEDRPLAIELAAGPRGGPVFDAYGRMAGLCLPNRSSGAGMLSVEALRQMGAPAVAAPAAAAAANRERVAVDQLYEIGMRLALQVVLPS